MQMAFRTLRALGALALAGMTLAGCATPPQKVQDLVVGASVEHPFLSQVAINLPTPGEMDVLETRVPAGWGEGLAGRAVFVPVPHGVEVVRVLSPDGSASFSVGRSNARTLSPAEKSVWWEGVRSRVRAATGTEKKSILQDPETGEVMTVTPLSKEYLGAAAISSMTEGWQRRAACGLSSVSTDDAAIVAAAVAGQPLPLAVRLGMSAHCYVNTTPNVLTGASGSFQDEVMVKPVDLVRHTLRAETCAGVALRCKGSAILQPGR